VLFEGKRAVGIVASGMAEDGVNRTGATLTVRARHVVLAGGGINNPGLLLRSQAADPHGTLGKRTFLHPVNAVFAQYAGDVLPWSGAPQSTYSDHFQWKDGAAGPMGFKLEALPLHPALASSLLEGYGEVHALEMQKLRNTNALLALLRDGFTEDSPGGSVTLRDDGVPTVDYPLTDALRNGFRRAFLAMAEIQFAAGATKVLPLHEQGRYYTNWAEAKAAIEAWEMKPYYVGGGSDHIMGGCGMGGSEKLGVVRPDGVHWQIENLSVHDGSVFPTSIGANPQLSIYGITNRMATQLAKRLTGRDVVLA
jgi:choline dehydrogenase-like flavoprotein